MQPFGCIPNVVEVQKSHRDIKNFGRAFDPDSMLRLCLWSNGMKKDNIQQCSHLIQLVSFIYYSFIPYYQHINARLIKYVTIDVCLCLFF